MKSWIKTKWSKFIILIPLLVLFVLGSVQTVQAAVFDEKGIVGPNETIDDDVFMSSEMINMDGTINGNFFGAGRTVVINGPVNGDVIVAGRTVILTEKAKVSGNLFIGGQTLDIRGKINGSVTGGANALYFKDGADIGSNVYVGGYHLSTEADTIIHRDLYYGGYQSVLNGDVNRSINISAAAVELNGTVGKNANLEVSSPDEGKPAFLDSAMPEGTPAAMNPGLRISKDAKIGGVMTYISGVPQNSSFASQPEGGVVYHTPTPHEGDVKPNVSYSGSELLFNAGNTVLEMVRTFFTLLILGCLVLWLRPAWLQKTQKLALLKPAPAAGYGLGVIILGYLSLALAGFLILVLGILLSVITMGGLSSAVFGVGFSGLAVITAVFTLVITYLSKLVVACLVGSMIIQKIAPQASKPQVWGLIIGVFLFAIIEPIPLFGWIISLLLTLVGVGVIWLLLTNKKMASLVEEQAPAA